MNIRGIAKEAGVSIATVSRVLNGKSDVSQETREKILTIIKEKEFKPKVGLSSVSDNIGIFICSSTTEISNPYSSKVISGIAGVIFKHGLNLSLIPSIKISKEGVEFFNFCNLRKISGGIFLSSNQDDTYIVELAKHVPTVIVGNDFEDLCVGSVRSDNFTGAYDAVNYLLDLGHKNILLVMADLHYMDHMERYEGAVKAMEEAGLRVNPYNIMNSYAFDSSDLLYKLGFIFNNSRPDAIFVGGDQEALRVIKVLYDMGLKVPDDISVVGYDNLDIAANSNPPLTTVNQPIYEIGREAAKLLLNMINNKDYKETKVLLKDNYLMARESVKERA